MRRKQLTVGELVAILQKMPQNIGVVVCSTNAPYNKEHENHGTPEPAKEVFIYRDIYSREVVIANGEFYLTREK